MDFKQLRSFVAVVDYRNFSQAAKKLNIAQSTVSMHLAQLENELGVKLAHRTTKTIEITNVGFKVYKYATQILELKNNIHESCTGDAHHIIRIAASSIPAAYILPTVCQQYRQLYPNDHLKISQCEGKNVIDSVLEGRFDVGLTDEMVTREGLRCVPICKNPMILITASNDYYLNRKQRGVSPKELLQEPLILREEGQDKRTDQILHGMAIDRKNLKIVANVNDLETLKNMVASGMGISLIPEIAAQDFINKRRILKIDVPNPRNDDGIYLVFPDRYTTKDHAWNFVDYINAASSHGFLWG